MGSIYEARNKFTGRCYVGQSISTMEFRRDRHKKDAIEKNSQLIFHRSIRKWGFDAFEWRTVIRNVPIELLNVLEILCIHALKTKYPKGYNMTDGGGGRAGCKHSKGTKQRISESQKGKEVSESHRLAISKTLTGRKTPFSEQRKNKAKERGLKQRGITMVQKFGKKKAAEIKRKIAKAFEGKTLEEIHGVEKAAEVRKKLSAIHTGKKRSAAARANMSEAQRKRPFTEEWRQRLIEARKNRVFTDEERQRMSKLRKGKKLGPQSKETKSRISASKTGVPWSPARWAAYEKRKTLQTAS